MALTTFGKAVRKARIDANETLLNMAQEIGTTPGFLSGMETGRKKIPSEWVVKISAFFKSRNVEIPNLQDLANATNQVVPVDGLDLRQQLLVSGFARSRMSDEQIEQFTKLLLEINEMHEQEKK